MNTFIEIKTPFPSLKTVKLAESDTFRPAATGDNEDQIRLKTLMEALEIQASVDRESGFVSSAAHVERDAAIENAEREANERISVAAWWAFDRPILGKASDADIAAMHEKYDVPSDYHFAIGFVETVMRDGYAAVSILENAQTYPYIVLGASFHEDKGVAAEKAFVESTQSWAASVWEKEQGQKLGLWDIAELRRRLLLIEQAPVIGGLRQVIVASAPSTHLEVDQFPDGYVAWVYAHQFVSGRTASLARLAMKANESYYTYTEHNQ
ncbi:MAG: hypothetical protein WAV04_00490 [Candidatus Microsaccharimonas sp.]